MPKDTQHVSWIASKVQATLSHFPQNWNEPQEVREMAMDDWLDALSGFSRQSVEQAFASHMRESPKVKPTPGAIREKARAFEQGSGNERGDRTSLSIDEQFILSEKVLPGARNWVRGFPPSHSLHQHGKKTLEFWGEAS